MIKGSTQVYGILGFPLSHSLSPLLHNLGFQFHNINAVYVPFPIEKPSCSTKEALLDLGIQGLSVTIPHKGWAARSADERDTLSAHCGAANTLIMRARRWHAYNTDGPGALQALREHVKDLRGKSFLLIGYGASANAIAHSLLLEAQPRLLLLAGRNPKKREDFVHRLRSAYPQYSPILRSMYEGLSPDEIDIVIHTTPLGMQGASQELPLEIQKDFIQKSHWVFDIVYVPRETPLLRYAASKGARTIPGYFMLLYQACLQFELFSGKKAPQETMEKALLRALRET